MNNKDQSKISFPSQHEFVIIKVNKVLNYGAFCSFPEYPQVEGFLHLREVASKWIKNINEYVKENMVTVAKVINIDVNKRVVDISLRRVTEDQKKKKLEEYSNEKRARKLIEVAHTKAKKTLAEESIQKILKDYEVLNDLLLDIFEEEVSAEDYFPKDVAKILTDMVKISIKKPKAVVRAIVHVSSYASDGLEKIKSTLSKIKNAKVLYLGAPRYSITITEEDYKTANKKLKKIQEALEKSFKTENFSFEILS